MVSCLSYRRCLQVKWLVHRSAPKVSSESEAWSAYVIGQALPRGAGSEARRRLVPEARRGMGDHRNEQKAHICIVSTVPVKKGSRRSVKSVDQKSDPRRVPCSHAKPIRFITARRQPHRPTEANRSRSWRAVGRLMHRRSAQHGNAFNAIACRRWRLQDKSQDADGGRRSVVGTTAAPHHAPVSADTAGTPVTNV